MKNRLAFLLSLLCFSFAETFSFSTATSSDSFYTIVEDTSIVNAKNAELKKEMKSKKTYSLQEIRHLYVTALEDVEVTRKLIDYLEGVKPKTPILHGYEAAFQALLAKHSWNPFNKLIFLKQSLQKLEEAIKMEKDNIELRFLRFSLLYYLPGFLKDENAIKQDWKVIVENIQSLKATTLGNEVLTTISNFMLETNMCQPKEKEMFLAVRQQNRP